MAAEKFHIKQIAQENRKQEVWSRRAYVDWVNYKLKAHFTNALEFRNGSMYVQLLDSLFPGVIPMNEVKFCAHMEYDCYQNFRILEDTFRKLGIDKNINARALSSGRHVESWSFLKWFKLFYDMNYDGKEYDPLKARKNAYMGFGKGAKTMKPESPAASATVKRHGKLLSHARSKSMVLQRGRMRGKSSSDENCYKVPEKTCRSVECLHQKSDFEFERGPVAPEAINTNCTVKSDNENSSKELVLVKRDRSQGDFEMKAAKSMETRRSQSQCFNLNTIAVNESQTYEDFGVRITENIQIRIESPNGTFEKNGVSDAEKRQQITLMIEKFLKYQWVERKEYFQTLADFFKKEQN